LLALVPVKAANRHWRQAVAAEPVADLARLQNWEKPAVRSEKWA
jgi:hypothetical protein